MSKIELFFFLLCLSGIMITSYKDFALSKGWTIGEYYSSDTGVMRTIGGLSFLGGILVSFFYIEWYMVLIGAILTRLMSAVLTTIFKEKTQIISVLILLSSFTVLIF